MRRFNLKFKLWSLGNYYQFVSFKGLTLWTDTGAHDKSFSSAPSSSHHRSIFRSQLDKCCIRTPLYFSIPVVNQSNNSFGYLSPHSTTADHLYCDDLTSRDLDSNYENLLKLSHQPDKFSQCPYRAKTLAKAHSLQLQLYQYRVIRRVCFKLTSADEKDWKRVVDNTVFRQYTAHDLESSYTVCDISNTRCPVTKSAD